MTSFASHFGRFFQIGYVARNIDEAVAAIEARTGATRIDLRYDLRDAGGKSFELQNLAHLALPGVEIEVIQPRLDRPSIYLDALPEGDDDVGLHHFGFLLPDRSAWEAAIARLDGDRTPVAWRIGNAEAEVAYVDTRSQMGHFTELVVRSRDASSRPLPS